MHVGRHKSECGHCGETDRGNATDGGEWACDENEMEERWLQKYLIPMSVIIAGESWDYCAEPKDVYETAPRDDG